MSADMEVLELHDGTMLRVHSEANCSGAPCPVHHPSGHPLRSWGHGWNGKHMLRVKDHHVWLDPDDFEYWQTGYAIVRNAAMCTICYREVVSKSVHDFQSCECGNVFVDGGNEYIRHGWSDKEHYQNRSIVVEREEAND